MAEQSQPLRALEQANRVRRERNALKLAVEAGDVSIERLIFNPPDCIERMPLIELLRWPKRMQRRLAARMLESLQIPELIEVGSPRFTVAQRRRLVKALLKRHRMMARRAS